MKIDTHNANPPQHRGERGKWPNLLLFVEVGTFKNFVQSVSVKRGLRTADCRLRTRGKMKTECKMQNEKSQETFLGPWIGI